MNDHNVSAIPPPSRAVGSALLAAPVDEDLELAALAKAVGHPARVQILRLLLARDSCFCGEIVDRLPLAQATVSQHLKVLRDAGLIKGEIDGPRTCYCANRVALARTNQLLGVLLAEAAGLAEDTRCDCI